MTIRIQADAVMAKFMCHHSGCENHFVYPATDFEYKDETIKIYTYVWESDLPKGWALLQRRLDVEAKHPYCPEHATLLREQHEEEKQASVLKWKKKLQAFNKPKKPTRKTKT